MGNTVNSLYFQLLEELIEAGIVACIEIATFD